MRHSRYCAITLIEFFDKIGRPNGPVDYSVIGQTGFYNANDRYFDDVKEFHIIAGVGYMRAAEIK